MLSKVCYILAAVFGLVFIVGLGAGCWLIDEDTSFHRQFWAIGFLPVICGFLLLLAAAYEVEAENAR